MKSGVWLLIFVLLCSAGRAAGQERQWVTPEVRDAIAATIERTKTALKDLPSSDLEGMKPDILALVAESDAFLKQDSRPAKHFAICLRRFLALALVSRIQTEEHLRANQPQNGPPNVRMETVSELWQAIRISEREWVEACIVPGSTVGRWAEANDVGKFLEDPSQTSPLPGYARTWLYSEGKTDSAFWSRISHLWEGPFKVGSSMLFAEACRLVQLFRDCDVYVRWYETFDGDPANAFEARLPSMLESLGNDRRLDISGTSSVSWNRTKTETALRTIRDMTDYAPVSGGFGRVVTRLLQGYTQDIDAPEEAISSVLKLAARGDVKDGAHGIPREPEWAIFGGLAGAYLEDSVYVFDEDEVPPERDPASGDPALTEKVRLTLPGEVALEMVKIPAGSFTMGSRFGIGEDYERPPHKVTFGYEFLIGKYEITQEQWTAVMGSNPSVESGGIGPSRPVQNVSWEDAQAFVKALNRFEIGTFRLPSEAEWEYACRGGTTMSYHFGYDESLLSDYAWFWNNSDVDGTGRKTQPVGQKLPNPYGLYDMYGNVWEWCQDRGFGSYTMTPRDGRAHDDFHETSGYTQRGGAFDKEEPYCRSASRGGASEDERGNTYGLRVVCTK